MKLTTLAKAACVVAVVGLAGAASANTYPLTTTALGQPTLLNGDFGTIYGGGSFDLFNLPTGNYELAVSGTPVGSAGGIFSGVISVDAVPLPSAVWLLLSGVLGVAAMTRRRVPAATRSV